MCRFITCKICLLKHNQLKTLAFSFLYSFTFMFLFCLLPLFICSIFLCLLLGEDGGRSLIV